MVFNILDSVYITTLFGDSPVMLAPILLACVVCGGLVIRLGLLLGYWLVYVVIVVYNSAQG